MFHFVDSYHCFYIIVSKIRKIWKVQVESIRLRVEMKTAYEKKRKRAKDKGDREFPFRDYAVCR